MHKCLSSSDAQILNNIVKEYFKDNKINTSLSNNFSKLQIIAPLNNDKDC